MVTSYLFREIWNVLDHALSWKDVELAGTGELSVLYWEFVGLDESSESSILFLKYAELDGLCLS